LPSQQQLRWSELRVGITVIAAALTLAVLIFLMSGTLGMFTPKLTLLAYFDNAEGLAKGAPVDLQGVAIGSVTDIRVVGNRRIDPVQVTMKVNTKYRFLLRKDTTATIATQGVLGQSFVDLTSKEAKGGEIQDGETLVTTNSPGLEDVVRSGQGTLQNFDILIKRLDRIVTQVESGQGSIGKAINDPTLYNRVNSTLGQVQQVIGEVSNGKGSIGKLLTDDELYRKANDAVDKVNAIIDQANRGEGTVGMLLKDPTLYRNANQAITKANQLVDSVNAGHGALGKLARDEEFAKKLDNVITRVSQMADKLNAGEGSVGKLLQDPSVYNNTDQMLIETRNLVKAIREDPKKYLTIHFRIF